MKLLLVDGHYYAYRSFFAIRNLSNSRGEPTNALYGMAKALKRMAADLQPDYAAVVMDGGLPAHRMEQHSEYKANRSEMPDLLSRQIPQFAQLAPPLGFTHLCVDGEEADDVLASYAVAASRQGIETILATNDKDLMQLVDGSVKIYQPGKTDFELIDARAVEEKWGIPPALIGDLLTLTGDSADNIPGVPGVGPKTAAGWLREFGSLDVLLANVGKLASERHRLALEGAREILARNRILVALRTGLSLPRPIEELAFRPDAARQAEVFAAFEFRGLLAEAQAQAQIALPPQEKSSAPGQAAQGELLF